MQVAILNWRDIHHPHAGGAEVVSHEQAKGLAARGHDVTLYTARFPGAGDEDWIDGYRVLRQGDRFSVYPRSAVRLMRRSGAGRPDVVLEHVTGLPWYAPLWSPSPTVTYFHHVVGPTYFQELPLPLAAAGWCAERLAPAVYRGIPALCPGEGSRRGFAALGYSPADFQVLSPGVRVDPRAAPGPKTGNPSVVFVGRIKRYKRLDLAIEAVARLRPAYPDLTFHIVGPDPDGLRPELARLAEGLGAGRNVEFHGRVPEEEKYRWLHAGWINLVASDQEGWGLTIVEAAACGTPSVASDIDGLSDALIPGVTGRTFRHGDAASLSKALAGLLADDPGRTTLGETARRFVESLTWERHLAGLERSLELVPRVRSGFGRSFPAAEDRHALLR